MPTTFVTSPDGRRVKVTHPDGATQEQILSYARQKLGDVAPAYNPDRNRIPTKEEQREKIAENFEVGGISIPRPLAEGATGLVERAKEIGTLGMGGDKQVKDVLEGSGAAVAGGAIPDIASLLAGGAALRAGGGALTSAPKVAKVLSAAGRGLSGAPKNVLEATLPAAAYGAATSEDRVGGALGAGLGSALGYGISKGVAGALSPNVSPDVALLNEKGVRLTPGRIKGGALQRTEDALTSIPLLGDTIKNANVRSMQDFNRATINDALEIVGEKLDPSTQVGRDAIAEASRKIGQRYDDILEKMPVKLDGQAQQEIDRIFGMIDSFDKSYRDWTIRQLKGPIASKFENPTQTALGQDFKVLMRQLRDTYKNAIRTNKPAFEQEAGKAIREVYLALERAAARQNPDLAGALKATDRAYAALSRIRDASEYAGAKDGVFTPAMYLRSIKSSAEGNSFSEGRAFGQPFAEAAANVLPQSVPDSGTIGRAAVGLGAGAATGMLSPQLIGPLAGAGALTAAYTQPGQAVLRAMMLNRPQSAEEARLIYENILAPYARAGAASGGVQLNQ